MRHEPYHVEQHTEWSPGHDSTIFNQYSIADLAEKKHNKAAFQKLLGLPVQPRALLVGVVASFTQNSGLQQVIDMLHGIAETGSQIIIVHDPHLPVAITSSLHSTCTAVPEDERSLHRTLAASDALLFPSNPQPNNEPLNIALRYGSVPIVPMTTTLDGQLSDYDPRSESGNAFLYTPDSQWSMFACIVRAVETYKLPFDWKGIQLNSMRLGDSELLGDNDDSVE